MATIQFTLSNADQTRLVNAITSLNGYQETINGQPNPETKGQFTLRIVREHLKAQVKQYERTQAQNTAVTTFDNTFVTPDIT